MEAELRGERARNMAGMSAEQLTRMQQAGSNILLKKGMSMNRNICVLERNVDSIESIRVTDLTFLSYF